MAATKCSAIDRECIPDSDSESGFSLDSDSEDINVLDCSSLNPASNYHTKLHFSGIFFSVLYVYFCILCNK